MGSMAARRGANRPPKQEEPSQLDRDAEELGHLVTQGGFRLGLLSARCVYIGEHGGDRSSAQVHLLGKVSVTEFAEKSGVSERKIRYYYRAWELAAETGICARPEDLSPGMEDEGGIGQWDESDEDEEQRQKWSYWMAKARKPKKEQGETIQEEIDEDFGTTNTDDTMSDEEATEADSSLVRNELLEILESAYALVSRLSQVTGVPTQENELLSQIASAALDLNSTANALTVQTQEV
jgi:hypothetical protein